MTQLTDISAALSGGLAPLSAYPQFVAWKLVTRAGQTKPTKVPIDAKTGKFANTMDPNTWSDHTTALHFAKQNAGYGVGFVFTADDPFVFVDIDNALQPDNTWSPLAHQLCTMFAGAFVEVSQSLAGLHIIGVGKRPEGFGCKADGFDIYDQGRFVALTGVSRTGDAATDCASVTDQLVRTYMAPETPIALADWSDSPREDWAGPADDDELLAIALRSKSAASTFSGKASFKDLWECNEDALGRTYPHDQGTQPFDHSAADMALLQHLAFYTGCDADRMDRMFRQSGLMRDKFEDRDDYRTGSVLLAISRQGDVFCDRSARAAAVLQEQAVAPPPSAGWKRPAIEPGIVQFGKEHFPNAVGFRATFYPNNSLVRIDEQDYRYNGKCWEYVPDDTLRYEITMASQHAVPSLQASAVEGTLRVLRTISVIPGVQLQDYPGHDTSKLINFDNGILNLDSLELLPHDPTWLTTNILPYAYSPGAACPHWEQFLRDVFEEDQERIDLLQEWLGYMLTGSYEHQKAMLMIGAPRSGKGTIGRVLKELVGPYNYAGVTLEGLAMDSVLDAVSDKPVVFIGDAHTVTGSNRSAVLTNLKQIIGNDDVSFNRKWIRHAHSGKLPCRITIAANGVPGFMDDSGALTNRFLILPFNKSFLGSEDPFLTDRLLLELPGICNWAVTGLQRLRATRRFTDVAAAAVEREDMEARYSPLRVFVAECCELTRGAHTSTEEMYNAYAAWCIRSGGSKMSRQSFTTAMRSTFRGTVGKKAIRIDGVPRQAFTGIGLVGAAVSGPPLQIVK